MVLHLNGHGWQGSRFILQMCLVKRGQITAQNTNRPLIRNDVVHVYQQDMLFVSQLEQLYVNQRQLV